MEKTFFKVPLFCDFVSFGGFFCVYTLFWILSLLVSEFCVICCTCCYLRNNFLLFCSLRKNFLETYHIPSPFTPWTRAEGLKSGHYVMAFPWSSTYREFLMHLLANELCGPLFTGRSNGVWAFWNCTFTSICRVFLLDL